MDILTRGVLKHFKLTGDPFADSVIGIEGGDELVKLAATQNMIRIHDFIEAVIEQNEWGAIAGKSKCGKTVAVDSFLQNYKLMPPSGARPLEIYKLSTLDTQRVSKSALMQALFDGLQTGKKPHSEHGKTELLNLELGLKSKNHQILLYIDEAHDLPGQTLKSLKVLREMKFAGRCPLLSVLMVGEGGLATKIRRIDKVRNRCRLLEVDTPTEKDLSQYLALHLAKTKIFSPEAVGFVILKSADYIEARQLLVEGMHAAMGRGAGKVELRDILRIFGGRRSYVLVDAMGLTEKTVARNIGKPVGAVRNALTACGNAGVNSATHEAIMEVFGGRLEKIGKRATG